MSLEKEIATHSSTLAWKIVHKILHYIIQERMNKLEGNNEAIPKF